MKRATLVLAAVAVLFGGVRQARAGFFSATAQVAGTVNADVSIDIPVSDGPNSGVPTLSTPVSASASGTSTSVWGSVSGSGQANARFAPPPGGSQGATWYLSSGAHLTGQDHSFYAMGGAVYAYANWSDVLHLSNTDPRLVGQTLRLNFFADGISLATGDVESDAKTQVSAIGTNIADNSGHFAQSIAGTELNSNGFSSYGWDSLTQNADGTRSGTFHLDIPIVPDGGYILGDPGSFYYRVQDTSDVSGLTASAADPSGFVSITLPDVGNVTPESLGVSVTFASGITSPDLQAAAVPEPASLVLFSIGALGMTGFAYRRRGGAAASGGDQLL